MLKDLKENMNIMRGEMRNIKNESNETCTKTDYMDQNRTCEILKGRKSNRVILR